MGKVPIEFTSVRAEIINHIIGHNKIMTKEYLSTLTDRQLLMEVHPTDYEYYAKLLAKKEKVS